jgi:hypothetical protein
VSINVPHSLLAYALGIGCLLGASAVKAQASPCAPGYRLIGGRTEVRPDQPPITIGGICEKLSASATSAPLQPILVTTPQYYVEVLSIDTLHTRAHTSDTLWLTTITANGDQTMPSWPALCRDSSNSGCTVLALGNVKNGVHDISLGPSSIVSLPTQLYSDAYLIQFVFSIAVWNYGFDTLVIDPSSLQKAQWDALSTYVDRPIASGPHDISAALNNHEWSGCDGPVFGMVFRYTPNELEGMTVSANGTTQTLGPVTIRSQLGCGASSRYSVTFRIVKYTAP